MENVIKRLSINYKKELDQLKINEHDSPIERIQYLKTILQTMKFREKILQDIDETQKLSNGKTIRLISLKHINDDNSELLKKSIHESYILIVEISYPIT
jgi:hypothetical protein